MISHGLDRGVEDRLCYRIIKEPGVYPSSDEPDPVENVPFRAIVVALFLLFFFGCRPGEEEEPSPSSGQPISEVDPTIFGDPEGSTRPETRESPAGDSGTTSLRPPSGQVADALLDSIPQDTLLTGNLLDRLDRLESENDSLRAAIGIMLRALSSVPGAEGGADTLSSLGRAEADSVSLTGEILNVDTRQVQHWGARIAVAILILALAGGFIRGVVWVLDKLAERNAKRRLLFKRLVPIARISLWFLAILFVGIVVLRIQAQGLIAAGAALGVAVGFAAQDILKNIFGGLIVLFDQPFQVGDKISVAGTYGEVVSIGLRSTRIVTPDDNLVSVPNAQVVDGQVANANAGELNCQVVTDLYLPGWVNESRAKRIAFEAAASSKYVFLNKPIVVLVKDEFRETFLTHLKVKAYVLDPRYEFLFMSDVTERARAGFREAGFLGPMHGVRAYVDLDRFPREPSPSSEEEENR
jgi:small-conductance mechanosensitive channel